MRLFPSDAALSRTMADGANRRLYSRVDIIRLWRTRFIAETGMTYDRKLLHYEVGGPSLKPPPLAPAPMADPDTLAA